MRQKSQKCHKYFLQYRTFASERPQVRTWGRQNLLIAPGAIYPHYSPGDVSHRPSRIPDGCNSDLSLLGRRRFVFQFVKTYESGFVSFTTHCASRAIHSRPHTPLQLFTFRPKKSRSVSCCFVVVRVAFDCVLCIDLSAMRSRRKQMLNHKNPPWQ